MNPQATPASTEVQTWTYQQVKAVLCELCKHGFSSTIYGSDGAEEVVWTHTVNGVVIPCAANAWRNKIQEQECHERP